MTCPSDITTQAKLLADKVNQEIADACETLPMISWQGKAEQIADDLIDSERWEFMWATGIGRYPQIVITRYTPVRFGPVEDDYEHH